MKPHRYRRYLLSGLLLLAVTTFYGAQAAPTNDFPTSRIPVAWPFAWDSIWNLPIGDGAVYVPAQIRYGDYGLYAEEDILILSPNAPLVDVIAHDADWDPNRKRCDSIVSPTQRLFTGVPVPAAFSTEPNYAGGGETPNHSAAILMPDGLTIRQSQPLHRCGAGGPVVSQYNFPDDNIKTGSGIDGAHGASSLSSMGGVIRLGELQPNSTIHHALKLVFDTGQYAYYNANDPTPGYRWPALSADSHAPSTYGGQNPALEMGALLALKPDFAVDNLRTEPAKIVARALRDYGAYWVDNAGWNAYYLTVEWSPDGRVLDEFAQSWGFPFVSPQPATCTNTADAACRWSKDMGDIFTNLHVVDNNSPQSIGGPGVRRQPCAPPFTDSSGAAPEYCPRSGNQPSTPPPNSTPTTTPVVTATPTHTPTLIQSAYQPPIGIPAPSFGIMEVAPAAPAAWPTAVAPGYYYIDNRHPNATDTNNDYGYPNRPRQSIPEITYPAGSYVEIHGGDYSDEYILVNFNCTRAQPCWVRGAPGNMPKISGSFVSLNRMTYVIFEYLDFEGGSGTSIEAGGGNHMVLRHSVVHNKTWAGNNAGVAIGARAGEIVHDIVVYKNLFHDLGNWQATTDEDFQAVAPGLWGLDETSGVELYNYWILENTCYHISGDCVQVNAGWGQGAGNLLHHIYIGKNISYQNRQNGFWSKQARDVIMSQNVAYGGRIHSPDPGAGMGYQYSLNNLWLIYNELYDNNFGILGNTDGDPANTIYIIGNVIRDNQNNLDPCGHWSSPNGWAISLWTASTRYIVNNTIYNTRGGIELINGGNNAPTFISNNIIANLNGMDYVNQSPACGDFTVAPNKVEHLSTNFVTSLTIDRNLFAQNNSWPVRINGFQSLAPYQAASGQCANCRTGDPLFVNAATGDFALQNGSPALDTGIEAAVYQRFFDLYGLNIRVDYRNRPRPQGQGWDIGAYEGNASVATVTPGATVTASTTPTARATPGTATPTATATPLAATPTRTPTPIQSATCGNGFIEAAEACDDGNRASGDGCTNQCVIEQSCYDPGNTFSFFTWSDSYGAAGDGGAMRLFTNAVNRTLYPNRVLPRFWVAAGDVPFVPGIEPLSIEAINGEISGNNYPFTCSASNRTFPMFVAMGNHDVDGDAAQIATKFTYWRDTIGQRVDKTLVGIQNFRFGPHNGYDERTTYSFDYKNAHFVVVNQYYGDPTYPTANPVACVRQTVYDWIDQDLANTTRPIKFVFGHEPAWSYCSNAPGYNGCINYGNNFTEDLLDPNERPRPHSPARQAWLEAYGRHWSDSLEDAQCPAINGQEGRSAFWAMLARHKVTAHLVGHTHTYGSRLVDADGPRNDPPVTQGERNRRAYGKNGDTFSNKDGVWEVDSAMTHNSAGSAYVLVTVRDNRVTFEAWDQMGANAEEEPFRLVESWHVDVEGAAPPTLPAGDCNSDGRVDAGDLSACTREIFDGDGNLAVNAPQGSFAGATTCDSNRDTLIAAGDLACTARLIFNSNATCTNASATAVNNSAHLAIATGLSGAAGTQVTVPVALNTNGAAVTSAAFTLRFDANYLAFDPTDANNDKIPDAITDQLPAGAFRSVEVGDNTIHIALTDLAEQPVALRDGPLLTVTFQIKTIVAAAPVTATVAFDNSPLPSLGNITGGEVAITTTGGAIRVQPVTPSARLHLPLIRRQ